MGMTIDKAIPKIQFVRNALNDDMEIAKAYDMAIETMRKYQMMQAEYEARLKADMVAMLTDIQLEIEELDVSDVVPEYQDGADETREYIADLLQQKIDILRGGEDGNDD